VSLDAGKSETATFQAQQSEPGEYIVDVNGNITKFTVAGPQTAAPAPVPEPSITAQATPLQALPAQAAAPPQTDTKGNIPVIWIIITLLIIVGAVIGLVLGRQKPPE